MDFQSVMASFAPQDKDREVRPSSRGSWSCKEVDEFDALSIEYEPKPIEKYPAKLHARQVKKYLGLQEGLIYLPGLPSFNYEDSDMQPAFRQRRYFYYLTGVNFPDCIVTYSIHRDQLWLWVPPPNSGRSVIYNGSRPTAKEIMAKYDFDHVETLPHLDSYLTWYAHTEPGKIHLLHDYQRPNNVELQITRKNGCRSVISESPFDSTKLEEAMNTARAIKSPYELKMIRKASAITAQGHINVLRGLRSLSDEAEIEAIFTATCIARQAKTQAYGVIAGSGENASTLHYMANNEPLKGRQLLCLDAGCEWDCYASDVTRTVPISGEYTEEAQAIYDLVAKMQDECIEMLKPGANYRDVHMHAHKVALRGLMELGLIEGGTFNELYMAGVSVAFFPHGLGHYVGLEVHDVGPGGMIITNRLFGFNKKPADWTDAYFQILSDSGFNSGGGAILSKDMVVTVEPGIYFSRYALEEVYLKSPKYAKYINKELLQKYYPVGGVRIEDDLLITERGYENLTTAPKGEEALKIINEGREQEAAESKRKQKKTWFW
ncbi:503275a9-89f5-4c3a-ad10-c651b43dddf4 [Sclerotinia trifoliorum]|uniref:Xaa-Pro aminopeptidase n=1 Tax=Sclerotinia trifoliorum TaxID=28548 RepID=A0A8H2VRD7_9HELO|nr:503275a9-89f5-4c3a-ad10-c651b43dddf4 [Sclerotinia trifoliorum]